MTKSGALSKSKSKWKFFLLFLLLLIAATLTFGPGLSLKFILARIAKQPGVELSYADAQASFLFRSIGIENLHLKTTAGFFNLDQLALDGFSIFTAWKIYSTFRVTLEARAAASLDEANSFQSELTSNASGAEEPLSLAQSIDLKNFHFKTANSTGEVEKLSGRDLSLNIFTKPSLEDISFAELNIQGLSFQDKTGGKFSFKHFEAEDWASKKVGRIYLSDLRLNVLRLWPGQINLFELTMEDVNDNFFDAIAAREHNLTPLRLLNVCQTLALQNATWQTAEGNEVIALPSMSFGKEVRQDNSEAYNRRLNFRINLDELPLEMLQSSWWFTLSAIFKPQLNGELALTVSYQSPLELFRLEELKLDLPQEGTLSLTGDLTGVAPLKSHFSPSQIIFGASTWRLQKAEIYFQNKGFMANYYRYLTASLGYHNPALGPFLLKKALVTPWQKEAALEDLPALLSEVDEFFKAPESLRLKAQPEPAALVLALAKLDKYAILKKLNLSLQVNERPALKITTKDSLPFGSLPNESAEPMENAFSN